MSLSKADFLRLNYTERLKYINKKNSDGIKPTPDISQPQKKKLNTLAAQIIGDFNNERKPDIITTIQTATGVNRERAQNGFHLMLDQKIISWGVFDRYYLTENVPF